MFKNREFKVGDEVVSIGWGLGHVESIEHGFITVKFSNGQILRYYADGKYNDSDFYPSLFHTDNIPFEMAGKWQEYQQSGSSNDKLAAEISQMSDADFNKGVDNPMKLTKPTETPIEQLKSGDSVWEKKGMKRECKFENIDNYFVYYTPHNSIKMFIGVDEFYNYFTTINPNSATTIPKPKINRAELLRIVEAIAVDYGDAAQCVAFATALLNEVNKVSYGE